MKHRTCILYIIVSLATLVGADQSVEARSTVTAAVVYTDRAQITRLAKVELSPGEHIVVVALPLTAIDESLRVSGSGPEGMRILGADVGQQSRERPRTVRSGIEEQIKTNQSALKDIDNRMSVVDTKRKLFESVVSRHTEQYARDLGLKVPDVTNYEVAVQSIAKNLAALYVERTSLDQERDERRRTIESLTRELEAGRTVQWDRNKSISVTVRVATKGTYELEITYAAAPASWHPSYDFRVNPATSSAELVYFADITQRTGEDWNAVSLTLSTAKPVAVRTPPDIYPWYIDVYRPQPPVYSRPRPSSIPSTAAEAPAARKSSVMRSAEAESEERVRAVQETAQASSDQIATTFTLKNPETIGMNANAKRVAVASRTIPVTIRYFAVPKSAEMVFMKAAYTNAADYPLLEGKMNIFTGDMFLSAVQQPLVMPDEATGAFLGPDERIKIRRVLGRKMSGDSGLVFTKKQIDYSYTISLENYHPYEVTVTVRDHMPVSRDEKIIVRTISCAPGSISSSNDRMNGLLEWDIRLAPNQKDEIHYSYQVEYPPEITVGGL